MAHDVTAPGQLRGNSDHANPVRSEHVVRRQAQRGGHSQATPPHFPASARGGELAFRSSKGPVHSAASLGGDGARWVGDVYFLLDGGMAHTSLHKAFQSKDKVSKSLTVLKDVISVDSKHEHPADRPC